MIKPRVDVIALGELSREDGEIWRRHHAARADSSAICESPDFLIPLSRVLGHCNAIRIREGEEVVGYVPIYQPFGPALAFPIPMCDYQAIAMFKPLTAGIKGILRQAGIFRWKYENVTQSLRLDRISRHFEWRTAPIVEIGDTFADYLAQKAAHGVTFQTLKQMKRRLARDIGAVSLVRSRPNAAMIDRLLECKQYRQPDQRPFDRYVREALLGFADLDEGDLRGMSYVLKAGEAELAFAFTLETSSHAFGWFCSYDPHFAKYSPGTLMILSMISDFHERKLKSFDLGPGGEPWKERFASAHRKVCIGHIYGRETLGKLEDRVWGMARSIRARLRA